MGLILDTSAIVAWERAQDADKVVSLEGDEELVMPERGGHCGISPNRGT